MPRILKSDLLSVLINQFFLSLGSILIVVILAQTTDQETFGSIRYLIALLAILAFWSLPGIGVVINQHAAIMRRTDLFDLIRTQFRWGLFGLCGAFVIGFAHALMGNYDLAHAFVLGGILSPIANLYLIPGLALAGIKQFRLKAIIDSIVILCTLIGVWLGVHNFTSVSGILFSYLFSQALITLCCLAFVYRALPPGGKKKTPPEKHAISGRQLTYLQIPFSLIPAIEKVIIFLTLGPVALALFVIAVLPTEHFKNAFRNLMQFYMLPHLPEENVPKLMHWFGTAALFLMLGTGVLILCILYIMPLLFTHFEDAQHLALTLVFSVLPLPIYVITIHWIARRHLKTLSHFALLAVGTNIFMIGLSSYFFGLIGAVVAKILHEIILAGGLLHLDRQKIS